jgi:hypothetical protein
MFASERERNIRRRRRGREGGRERKRGEMRCILSCSRSSVAGDGDSAVIGLVDPPGVWLVVVNDSIACLNTNPSQLRLSIPPTRKEVEQVLQNLLDRSRSTGGGDDSTTDSGYLDINRFLHNLTKI